MQMKWQPIDTAPRDGTAFLAVVTEVNLKYDNPGQAVGVFDTAGHFRVATGWVKATPTRWMPLPTPP
jgi:hypothetical protein